ncbi:hypothetical protein ACNSTU_11225 [Aquisalimonas sp. APHAB1-3]|uniref:hypothetical protein n=1 Tax=Aquisalimonas sp. APHAB1-3 TaxID=3402080 RepID=UPI003AABA571
MTAVTHILWTGGWDSTYRVIELLGRSRTEIQGHYIVDPVRTSSGNEIATIDRLRAAIGRHNGAWAKRMRPLQVSHYDEIPPDGDIDAALEQLRAEEYLGKQYAWLARYVKASDTGQMDLCIEATDAAGRRIADGIRRAPGSEPPNYELWDGEGPLETLFRWFRFPLIQADKKRMEQNVHEWGMWPVMKQTWFCHQPVMGRYACGTCRPCVYVMNKGQAWRMGYMGRARFVLIEQPRRMVPGQVKTFLRGHAGAWVRRMIRS